MNSSRICCTRLDEPSGSYETEKGIWCWYCWWYQWLWSVEQFLKGIRTQKSSECVGSIFFADVGLGRQQMYNISIKWRQGFSVCNLTILLEHSGKHGFQIRKDIQIYHTLLQELQLAHQKWAIKVPQVLHVWLQSLESNRSNSLCWETRQDLPAVAEQHVFSSEILPSWVQNDEQKQIRMISQLDIVVIPVWLHWQWA